MSLTHTTTEYGQSNHIQCNRCHTILPPYATFCGSCGARIERAEKQEVPSPLPQRAADAERYRITSLIRHHPYTQLFLAIDTHFQRPVIIRDIDVSGLNEEARAHAYTVVQQEYDLLRNQRIPNITPAIDLRNFQGHLFLVAAWPFPIYTEETGSAPIPGSTLHDLLQSNMGLPDEDIAITWLYRLSSAVERLHSHQIILGDLDPQAILVSDDGYEGLPALAIAWLPPPIRAQLPPASVGANISSFSAPETRSGIIDPRFDVYSLGAILYLLLTGKAPAGTDQHPLTSPRSINTSVSSGAEEVVMRALSSDPAERFQNANELSEALLHLCSSTKPVRPGNRASRRRAITQARDTTQNRHRVQESEDTKGDDTQKFNKDPHDVTVTVVPRQAKTARTHRTHSRRVNGGDGLVNSAPTENGARAEDGTSTGLQEKSEQKEAIQSEDNRGAVHSRSAVHKPAPAGDKPASGSSLLPAIPQRQQVTAPQPLAGASDSIRSLVIRKAQPLSHLLAERLNATLPALPRLVQPLTAWYRTTIRPHLADEAHPTILKYMHRFLVGEQHLDTTAAAIIETPMRLRPNQMYVVRIHIMGRNQPAPPPYFQEDSTDAAAGLSGMIEGDVVSIEVRSSLYQNYAYIVQNAYVQVPGYDYAAEVTIPMQAISIDNNGRRERLQIFFMDEMHRPLYEKPFVIELFISPHVQAGHEGHNTLLIPL